MNSRYRTGWHGLDEVCSQKTQNSSFSFYKYVRNSFSELIAEATPRPYTSLTHPSAQMVSSYFCQQCPDLVRFYASRRLGVQGRKWQEYQIIFEDHSKNLTISQQLEVFCRDVLFANSFSRSIPSHISKSAVTGLMGLLIDQ